MSNIIHKPLPANNEAWAHIFKALLVVTALVGLSMLSMDTFAQDSGGSNPFDFKPDEKVKEGLESGSTGWWVTFASLALDGSLVYAVVAALWPSLRRTLWVPFVVFLVAYFGGGSSQLMKDHVEESAYLIAPQVIESRIG